AGPQPRLIWRDKNSPPASLAGQCMFTSPARSVNAYQSCNCRNPLSLSHNTLAEPNRRLARLVLSVGKLALGLAIVGYLVYQAQQHQRFSDLLHQPKNWNYLIGALACVALAISLGFVRWYLLVQA